MTIMRPLVLLAPFQDLPTSIGQQHLGADSAPTQPFIAPVGKPDRFGVYTVGGPVTSPVLTYSEPAVYPTQLEPLDTSGSVMVTTILGADGIPSGTNVLIPLQRPLNRAAVRATNRLRFEPAKFNGHPVPVRIFIEFKFPRGEGMAPPTIVQRSNPIEPPVALNSCWVAYPRNARKKRMKGTVAIAFVVSQRGEPTDLHLIRSVARELDESALRAVRRLRFKPAAVDGKPVPAYVTIEVSFLLYY